MIMLITQNVNVSFVISQCGLQPMGFLGLLYMHSQYQFQNCNFNSISTAKATNAKTQKRNILGPLTNLKGVLFCSAEEQKPRGL